MTTATLNILETDPNATSRVGGDIDSTDSFLPWLLRAMAEVEGVDVPGFRQELDALEICGEIVHEAGRVAARLGHAEICDQSIKLAPYCESPEHGIASYVCNPSDARVFLSRCIGLLKTLTVTSAAKAEGDGELTGSIPRKARKAYEQLQYARSCKSKDISLKDAYTFTADTAKAQGKELLASFASWQHYLREYKRECLKRNLPFDDF